VTVFVPASRRYRYEYVRWEAEKKRPFGFHATIDGSSSNDDDRTVGVPPPAGTAAIAPLA
jgi:hypothetical protein